MGRTLHTCLLRSVLALFDRYIIYSLTNMYILYMLFLFWVNRFVWYFESTKPYLRMGHCTSRPSHPFLLVRSPACVSPVTRWAAQPWAAERSDWSRRHLFLKPHWSRCQPICDRVKSTRQAQILNKKDNVVKILFIQNWTALICDSRQSRPFPSLASQKRYSLVDLFSPTFF